MEWAVVRIVVAGAVASLPLLGGPARASTNCQAVPGNLVQNCGFETGDLSGWSGGYGDSVQNGYGYGGGYGLRFGALGTTYPLSQTLDTSANTTYSISFMVNGSDFFPDEISLSWGGVEIFDQLYINAGWQQYNFTETATTAATVLTFGLRDDNYWDVLDNITVTAVAVPEPLTLAVLGAGLFGIGVIRLRPRRL